MVTMFLLRKTIANVRVNVEPVSAQKHAGFSTAQHEHERCTQPCFKGWQAIKFVEALYMFVLIALIKIAAKETNVNANGWCCSVCVRPACYTHSARDIWLVNAGRLHDSSRNLMSPGLQMACNQ